MKRPERGSTPAARKARTRKTSSRKTASKKPKAKRAPARRAPAKAAPKRMKAYASFDLYLADQPPENQRVIRELRRFVGRAAPALQESVKWGNGCWLKEKQPVAYVYSAPDHVQFGFFRGASLDDPEGLLQGAGQYVRHVKLRKPRDIDEAAFAALLRQAAR